MDNHEKSKTDDDSRVKYPPADKIFTTVRKVKAGTVE